MKKFYILTFILLLSSVLAANSEAEILKWDFNADNGSGGYATGSFGWDTSTSDQSVGEYYTGYITANVIGGVHDGLSFTYDSDGTKSNNKLFVQVNTILDDYSITIGEWTDTTANYWLARIQLSGKIVSTDDSLPTSINFSDFAYGRVFLGPLNNLKGYDITSIMTSSTPSSPVPEPSTIVLMGLGLVGLAGLGRNQMKR